MTQRGEPRPRWGTATSCEYEGSSLPFRHSQAVADSTNGMNQLHRLILLKLLAQTIDVDFHQICLAVEVAIPHMLDNFAACDQLGSAQQEKLEQREFLRGKRNYFMATRGASPVTV